ncbi:MAG: cytochrome b [Alphaproteobacteria bacterium]
MSSTESASYTRTAKVLHWLIALAIIFMLALGWCMDFFPKGDPRFAAIQLHKSIGITILLLSFVRLGWRSIHRAPPFPTSMSLWEQRAAHAGHLLLYVAMIGMPLTGWAMVSASPRNIPTILYGVLPWPALPYFSTIENKKEMSHFMDNVHDISAYLLAALIAGHAAAALKHHFISRDDILLRMTPRFCAAFLNRLRGQP